MSPPPLLICGELRMLDEFAVSQAADLAREDAYNSAEFLL